MADKRIGTRVDSVGPLDADIFILGETPGRDELGHEPFVGQAGRELDKLLTANGIARSDCYITNTVKTFVGAQFKEEIFFSSGNPTSLMMDGIIELAGELKKVQPNVVAAVGDYALWAMCQIRGITSYRGSILESTLVPGQKVIPVIHPAWFLHTREWHKLPLTEWDWARVKKQSMFPEIKRNDYHLTISPTQHQLDAAAETLLAADHITVDSEWYSPETLAYIQFTTSKKWAIAVPANAMMAFRFYKKILSSDVPKWMQNAMFDVPALHRIGIETVNMEHDTMIAWNATFGDLRSKSLATISSVLTEEPYYKDEVAFVGSDDERGQKYGCLDVIVTDESMDEMLSHEFNIWGTKKGYDITMATMDTFLNAAKVGTLCDVELLRKRRAEVIESANEREDALSQRIGYTINCRSTVQVAELVYDRLAVKRAKRSTAQEHLMDIASSTDRKEVHDILLEIILVRRDRKRASSFLNENIVDVDGRIRCNWNLAGTRNGRFSTTKPWWNGVAVQTYPYMDRDIFIADPGCVFVGWDLEQAEARVVAHLTNDWELLEDLERGIDIHTKLASQLPFGMTYEELLVEIERVGGKDECEQRVLSKTCRHGMNYYLTWSGLKTHVNKKFIDTKVGINAARAKELRASYLRLSPGLPTWWHEVYLHIREHRYMVSAYGRRRNFFGRMQEGDHLHRDGIAYYPQSSVHDSTLLAIAEMTKEADYGQVLADMHDGGYMMVPEDMKDDAVEVIHKATQREMIVNKELCIIPTEVKVGSDWKNMKAIS